MKWLATAVIFGYIIRDDAAAITRIHAGVEIDIGCRVVYNHHDSINETASHALTPARSTRVTMWNGPDGH